MGRRGRRALFLRAETRERLLDALRAGATHQIAADHAGISVRTLYSWMAWGREGAPTYAELLAEMEAAQAGGALQCLAVIREVAVKGKQWQAAAWLLERRYPSQYGRPETRRVPDELPPPAPGSNDADVAAALGISLEEPKK